MSRKVGGREATTGVIPGEICLSVGKPDRPTPEGWRWVPLLDVARLESGHTPSRRKPEYWGGEVPWIGIKDATGNHGRTICETIQHTNEMGIKNSAARILPANTVCLSRTASVGYVVVMGKPMATSQDFANWVCGPALDHRFLKYALLADNKALHRFSYGSTHQTIYFPELKAFHVCMPEVDEQAQIASILGALDDKIELNRRMAATLEEMARALYRSWFVDFDPVKAKAEGLTPVFMDEATAALFPDRFGDDGLPEGWRRGALIDLSSLNPEKWGTRNAPDMVVYVDLSNTKWGVVEATTTYSWTEAPSRARMVLRPGDTIVGTVRPGNGSYAYIAEAGLTGSTGFAVLRPNRSNDAALVNLAATDADNIASLTNLADGGAYPAVRPEVVGASEVVIAAEMVRDAFAAQVTPIVNRIEESKRESRSLAELRDALLPKLMSGEIRVGTIDNQIEAVA